MSDEIIVYVLVGVVAILCVVMIVVQLVESKLMSPPKLVFSAI